jgi:hypothetical protein
LFDPNYIFAKPILGYLTKGVWETIYAQINGKPILNSETIRNYAKSLIGENTTFADAY